MKIFKNKTAQEIGRSTLLWAIFFFVLFLVLVTIYTGAGKIIVSTIKKLFGF